MIRYEFIYYTCSDLSTMKIALPQSRTASQGINEQNSQRRHRLIINTVLLRFHF